MFIRTLLLGALLVSSSVAIDFSGQNNTNQTINSEMELKKVMNTVIVGKNLKEISENFSKAVSNLNEEVKIKNIINNIILGLTAETVYEIALKNKGEDVKKYQELINQNVEMKFIDFMNGKTVQQIFDSEVDFLRKKQKYEDLYNELIKKEINKNIEEVHYDFYKFVFAFFGKIDFEEKLADLYYQIDNPKISKIISEAIYLYLKKHPLEELNGMTVKDMLFVVVKENQDFKNKIEKIKIIIKEK